jgi:hypothetical protein
MDLNVFALKQADGVEPSFRGELIGEASGEKTDDGKPGRENLSLGVSVAMMTSPVVVLVIDTANLPIVSRL